MKYRLKDRELQAKLDEISGGDFSELLGGVEDTGFSALRIPLCGFIEDAGQTIPRVEVYVRRQDVEEVPQYDQNKWNKWPDVEPPEKTRLRIEVITERIGEGTQEPSGGKVRLRGCATFSHGFWMLGEKITVKPRETVRFRPWEDEE